MTRICSCASASPSRVDMCGYREITCRHHEIRVNTDQCHSRCSPAGLSVRYGLRAARDSLNGNSSTTRGSRRLIPLGKWMDAWMDGTSAIVIIINRESHAWYLESIASRIYRSREANLNPPSSELVSGKARPFAQGYDCSLCQAAFRCACTPALSAEAPFQPGNIYMHRRTKDIMPRVSVPK